MTDYPRREPYYAHRYVRILHKSCAAQDIGQAACYLCCVIVHTEDAARFAGPARFWNSQLMETMGFSSPKQLDTARDRAVARGWLHYSRAGNRAVGEYFATIPDRFNALSDTPIEPPIHSPEGMNTGTNTGMNHDGFVPKSTQLSDGSRNEKVTKIGKHSYPIPNPTSCPAHPSGDAATKAGTKYSPEDEQLAQWIWSLIVAMQPGRKPPRMDKWASTIRLMREVDGRTHDEIRKLFGWCNRDEFWRTNILSPEKLREKWDDLTLKMTRPPRQQAQRRDTDPSTAPTARVPSFTEVLRQYGGGR
ncbi:MAG: phage replication protein [Pirellulaceae bacterium]